MIYSCTSEDEFNDICLFVNLAVQFLGQYLFITNAFITEYFNENQWNLLPNNWRISLQQFDIEKINLFLLNQLDELNHVLPLSLLCFRKCCDLFKLENCEIDLNQLNLFIKRFNKDLFTQENKNNQVLINSLVRHLKPKKFYEINKFTYLVSSIVDSNLFKLYDFGSGQGHLARYLVLKYKFDVTTVDANEKFLTKAKQFDEQAVKEAGLSKNNLSTPLHLNLLINKNNYFNLTQNELNYGLIGLHCCGNLSHDLLNLYKNFNSKYLFLCSCCYHKTQKERYLISDHLLKLNLNLSIETRANACHSFVKFIKSFNSPENLKIHCYRALLESILENKFPEFRKKQLSKVNNLKSKSFSTYFCEATKNLVNLNLDVNKEENEIKKKLHQNLNVITFYSLRTLLGPVTETIFLLDQMIFLYEIKQIHSHLIPLFTPLKSPRNFILFSKK